MCDIHVIGSSEECFKGFCGCSWTPGGDSFHHSVQNGAVHQPQGVLSATRTHHYLPYQCSKQGVNINIPLYRDADFVSMCV